MIFQDIPILINTAYIFGIILLLFLICYFGYKYILDPMFKIYQQMADFLYKLINLKEPPKHKECEY